MPSPFTITIENRGVFLSRLKHISASAKIVECAEYINKNGPFHIVLSLQQFRHFGSVMLPHSHGSGMLCDIVSGYFTFDSGRDDEAARTVFSHNPDLPYKLSLEHLLSTNEFIQESGPENISIYITEAENNIKFNLFFANRGPHYSQREPIYGLLSLTLSPRPRR